MARVRLSRMLENQRGFSIVEALVATALLGTVIVISAEYSSMFSPFKDSLKRVCQAQAQGIINIVQEETYNRQVTNWMPTGFAPRYSDPTSFAPAGPSRAVPGPAYWFPNANADYTITEWLGNTQLGPKLGNFQLIQGSLRTLSAIYERNPQVACAFGGYAPLTGVPMPSDLSRTAPVVRMRLQPYDRATGAPNCVGTLNIAPEPYTHWDGAVSNSGNVNPPANEKWWPGKPPAVEVFPGQVQFFSNQSGNNAAGVAQIGVGQRNIGIEMTVHIDYVPDPGAGTPTPDSCEVTQKFEYPPDITAPAAPNLIRTVTNTTNPQPYCQPNPVANTAQIQVGYRPGFPMEPGTQLLCHDLSWRKGYNLPSGPPYNPPPCIRFPGGIDLAIPTTAENPNLQTFSVGRTRWMQCDHLIQCGVAPNQPSSYVNNGGGPYPNPNNYPNGPVLTLTYVNLPLGCQLNFEAVAVDTAGNVSALSPRPATAVRTFLDQLGGNYPTPANPANEMHYSTCTVGGVFCAPSGPVPSKYWRNVNLRNGYWTCRPQHTCCVNVPRQRWCTAFN